MAYRTSLFPIIMSDIEGLSYCKLFFKCDFSYRLAAVDQISNDTAC